MKRYVVTGLVVAGFAVGLVSSAGAIGPISVGVRVGIANFAMGDVNDEIADVNEWIDENEDDAEAAGWTFTGDHLPEIESGMDIEGYLGIDIRDNLQLRFIGGLLSKKISGGWHATRGTEEDTLTLKEQASCYFVGIEPAMSLDFGRMNLSVGAGLAYYLATFDSEYVWEGTWLPTETESLEVTGQKLGYHGFLEGKLPLSEKMGVGVAIGYRSTGKIKVTGDSQESNLDFSGIFYSGFITMAV